jgi:hypothetical protein
MHSPEIPSHTVLLGVSTSMISIRDLVQQALATGFLSVTAEDQLRSLLRNKYSTEDMRAFMQLQLAAMNGWVKQESRELLLCQQAAHLAPAHTKLCSNG